MPSQTITAMIAGKRYHFSIGFEAIAYLDTVVTDPRLVEVDGTILNPGRVCLGILSVCGMEFHPETNWVQLVKETDVDVWEELLEVGASLLDTITDMREEARARREAGMPEVPEPGTPAYMAAMGGRP